MFKLLITTLLLAISCNAAELNCNNLDAEACKRQFADIFNTELNALQHGSYRKLCQKYIEISFKIQKDLSPDDLFYLLNRKSIDDVTNDLIMFDKNIADEEKLAEISRDTIHHIEFTFEKGTADPEHYRASCNKHQLRGSLGDIVKELTINIGKLWSRMYKNLRASDLKAYPDYEVLNKSMEKLENFTAELKIKNDPDFQKATKALGIQFQVPYYDGILEVS